MAQNTQTAKLQFLNESGIDIIQTVGLGGAVQYSLNANGGFQVPAQALSASGAVNPRLPGFYVITKAGVAAITLTAPTAGTDDGLEIEIASNTANAHTVNVGAGNLLNGAGANAQVAFPAFAGAGIYLTAYQGKWFLATYGVGTYTIT
jgi:hypothetical protein